MYSALWRKLPGNPLIKVIQLIGLAGLVGAAMVRWIFPFIASVLLTEGSIVG